VLLAAVVAACVVTCDQLTKTWAEDRLARGAIHVIWKLDLSLAFNSGSAFSLAQGWAPILAGMAVLAVVVLLAVVRHVGSSTMACALGLVVGGAAGNLCDRIFRSHHGSVIDFIAFHFWPTFNLADTAIVVGAAWAAWLSWRYQGDARARAGS
jgi:signal peptidase II